MVSIKTIVFAFFLDILLGDPYNFPHPVKLMGRIIRKEEEISRKLFKNERGLRFAGGLIVLINIFLGFTFPYIILKTLDRYKLYYAYNIFNIYLIYSCLAARSLSFEAKKVQEALGEGLEEGRHRVSYIVGRQTDQLSYKEIIQATIETVAENTADGVIAPLFYIFLGGAPAGVLYKFVNTMDSTLGYTNDDYINIGRYPAINDDIFNYIPSKITALLMLISSIGKYDVKRGYRVFKRDRKNHRSPNSGYPESAVAGLLGIRLGGDNYYNGILVKKPTMGDPLKSLELSHINEAINIMYRSEILFIILYIIVIALKNTMW